MIRVLQIVDHMGIGGIQAFIMNVYRNIDRDKYQFDFLLHRKDKNAYAQEIERLGGIIYYVPARNQGIIKNIRTLNAFFKRHREYKVVHQHESSLSYIEPLIVACNNNVPVRIIHSHSTRMGNNMIHRVLHYLNAKRIHKIATNYLACGELAGKWFYGESKVKDGFSVVINGIRLRDYEYDEIVRSQMRENLGIGKSVVYCHVGRFDEVKNHRFLIDVFKEIQVKEPSSMLVLVGQGILMDDIKKKVKDVNLDDKVIFLGFRKDINRILQAVDAVILPSIYEGFPVTAIEAQAAGLPFFMSDSISKEAIIKSNAYSISLEKSAKFWADFIIQRIKRLPDNSVMYKGGFDIGNTIKTLCDIYINGECKK